MKKTIGLVLIVICLFVFAAAMAESWVCPSCSSVNENNFCPACGTAKPEQWTCQICGYSNGGSFCENCGVPKILGKKPDFQPTVINEGKSMIDSIQDGDILLFTPFDANTVKRFDVVSVHYPNRDDTLFVKRVIGMPGETIEIKDGWIYINGEMLDDTEFINPDYRKGMGNNFGPYAIPEEHYFVLGDHRNNSNDSRFVGALPIDMMLGIMTENLYESLR